MANKVKNDAITSRDEDFAKWYTDVCRKAELMDYSSVKGFIIYRPYGYALWEMIQAYMDKKFKETGHENVYMPMLIPESLLQKEADHVEGFAPECVHATGFEGKSIAIQEAQTLGLPIIASESNREQIENGVDGILCRLEPEAVSEAVCRMMEDEKLRNRYREAG